MYKELEEILDKTKSLACKIKDYDESKMTSHDYMEAFDLMKDTAMTMKYLAEKHYYDVLTEAMEEHEEEYGETWDYKGRKYRMPMIDRDIDINKGRMYYTEPIEHDYREGKAGKMRKAYMEHKETHNDANANMSNLEKWLKTFISEIKEKDVWDKMSQSEKNMTRQILQTAINEM